MTHDELAAGFRGENPDAWNEFFDSNYDRLARGVARLMAGDQQDVADVIQETFMEAARSARQFDPARGSIWTWLWGIARNRVALHYRQGSRHQRVRECADRLSGRTAQFVQWLGGADGSPPDQVIADELAELIQAALSELPDDYASLLNAKYLDGEDVRDIAERHGHSESAVRSKLARARSAFRDAFIKIAGPSDPASHS